MGDRLKWLEGRILSSLKPRNEDLKNLLSNDDNRLAFYEFINNEDVKKLFVYLRSSHEYVATLLPPSDLQSKSIFFLKCNPGTKLTRDNMDQEVFYIDSPKVPLEHLELIIREVFLPLLGTNVPSVMDAGINSDKVMDLLHRLMAVVEVTQGHVTGENLLNLPSIEVLAEAAASPNRRAAVLHVLETTIINWIKQIRIVLKHDPKSELLHQFGSEPGPLDEIAMWEKHLSNLNFINRQLDSDVAQDILHNLEQANSQYAHSFSHVRKDINKAVMETKRILTFLSTMKERLTQLHIATDPTEILKLFKPLMTIVNLVWSHSAYYHQPGKFKTLLRLLSNEVVHRAIAIVGEDVLREPLESYTKLKEALRVCAAFRGTYLDFKDKADERNIQNITENAERLAAKPQGHLFTTKMYGPLAYTPRYGLRHMDGDSSSMSFDEEELWINSPWPARNAACFSLLNSFMERCNDVLELVETTRHFRLLAGAAEVGGAGSVSLDAMVKEIHLKYTLAMNDFFSVVDNVLNIDGSQLFERSFFKFRTVVKKLEKRLAGILRQAFSWCPTVEAQLRLLEVFEGISSRELVQMHLKDKDTKLVQAFTAELTQVREMFREYRISPPPHYNMPPIVSKLIWVHALKERIRIPMEKLRHVSPHSMEGESGWQMRNTYNECSEELDEYQVKLSAEWQNNITSELTLRLKTPLLIAEDFDEDEDVRPQLVNVNLDPQLLLLLREIRYLSQEPFNIKLPEAAKELIRNTNSFELSVTATRLETIVSKYNQIMKTITHFEKPLFERKLDKIDTLFEQGLQQYTWKMKESADFIETAMSLVCIDVHQNLDIVQTNCHEIAEITISWSKGLLDVFQARNQQQSYSMEELLEMQRNLTEDHDNLVVPSGYRIHTLVNSSFEAVQISQASPAWQDYIEYIDAIVLDGLKTATFTSLQTMHNTLVQANITEDNESIIPILTIRLELIENKVSFRPPLDQNTSVISVQELVLRWLDGFLARGKLVKMLGLDSVKGSYEDYIAADEEVTEMLLNINKMVEENSDECKKLLDVFKDYSFLWLQDVNQTFEQFLGGILTPNPMRSPSHQFGHEARHSDGEKSPVHSRASSAKSNADGIGQIERSFLTPKGNMEGERTAIPSLDEFDAEIEIYKNARDEIYSLEDYHPVGWLRVDLQPIKQVLTTYASKWMWTFTKYLSDQVTLLLEKLDQFLKRIEPEIEGITGEEKDTASFMKMMRLFNEVSAQQSEMDDKFSAMHRTVLLLKKYGQKLPENTQYLFTAAPGRWNNLKTKVSLAKQRLGPRIQEESASITKDLEAFSNRVMNLDTDLTNSDVYNQDCDIRDAWIIIDQFVRKLTVLENEAQDLIELQELLETSVVNFSILPQCRFELNNLKQVWETVRVIDEQQTEWKRHRWQKMNTKFLREETTKQLEIVRALPKDVSTWDVYNGLHYSITMIQDCLPLIDDLSNPAMRTRHWKQLVRVTGGALTVDNDMLKRMTLGELLSLGLQKHVDDVRAIVQRAVKDLSIEQSLKKYEEVWLSKIFELRTHVRSKVLSVESQENQSECTQSEAGSVQVEGRHVNLHSRSQARTASRVSNQSSHGRAKRNSISSLPLSFLNLGEETGPLMLLTGTESIFDELDSHQVTLQTMQSSSAAGSFLDEVMKWQKKLQTIEAVLTIWLETQEKWEELEDIFSGADIRVTLSHDANRFTLVNRDFRLLMRATERNPNVLQCCSRKHILNILEDMNHSLDSCRRSLLNHLERRRQIFPRFFFLALEDVLHIVCNGYDLNQVNLYINKLFENVGSLVFEVDEDTEKTTFVITGVQSMLGERLNLIHPVKCEGQIEIWLAAFTNGLKAALQLQMAIAMGAEKPPKVKRIKSAGALQVNVPQRLSSASGHKGERSDSRQPSRQESQHASQQASREASRQSEKDQASNKSPTDSEELEESGDEGSSWTLDHVSEIVYLATQCQVWKQIQDALESFEQGEREALTDCLDRIARSILATTLLLKGLEGEKEKSIRKEKEKTESEAAFLAAAESEKDFLSDIPSRHSVVATSKKGSILEMGMDASKTPLKEVDEEEENAELPDTESFVETNTMQPLDTMNIMMPVVQKTSVEEAQAIEEQRESLVTETKLMLFPSQVKKLTCLLSLLAHSRDILQRLIVMSEMQSPITSFDWRCQLRYEFNKDPRSVSVGCFDAELDYGFEYLGSSGREVITPITERVFVILTQAVKAHQGALCCGPSESGKFETVCELARSFGQALYIFSCTSYMEYNQLHDIFKGLASTGCWVCFNNMNKIQPAALSVFAQLMATVMDALSAGKSSVHLQSDDIQLCPTGACFGLLCSCVPVTARNPDKLLLYMSSVATLPSNILQQFRVISMDRPDLRLALEVMLFSQGFSKGAELAEKTVQLYDMCSKVFGTNTYITEHITLGSDRSASLYGWSIKSLKGVVSEAGAYLERAITEMEEKQSVADTSEDEGKEKHEMEESEKGTSPGELVLKTDKQQSFEDEALVTAMRDTFLPRMQNRDASIFSTFISDLWPDLDLAMTFGGDTERQLKPGGLNQILQLDNVIKTPRSDNSQKSLKESLKLNTPVVTMAHAGTDRFSAMGNINNRDVLDNIVDAIAVATGDLGLLPGTSFQARVVQLAQLNSAHQTILVVGPPGCGKSECIKTFAVAERERGKTINIQSIFLKAVESEEIMGYVHPKTMEWKEGLLTSLLRKFCIQPANLNYDLHSKPSMKVMQLDGEADPHQLDLLDNVLNNTGSIVLANNERIVLPDTLRFIWEIESLEHLSPSLLANVGVLAMNTSDVGWKLMLVQWLEQRGETDMELLSNLCNQYVEKVIDYLTMCTQPAMFDKKQNQHPVYHRVIMHTPENMVRTMCSLLETLLNPYPDLSELEYERYFNFACIWSFGGTLAVENRELFSNWWREQFEDNVDYPQDGTVFDYVVDSESHEFCRWADMVPSYTGTPHEGIPSDALVHTVHVDQLLHIVGLLSDAGRHVMLVGENGCGKTSIVNERIRTVCSGEVAEVLSLTIYANRFTNSHMLYERLDERLEWKHSRTFVPKGNKRLLCLIDDLNLSQVDRFFHQTATELVREHVDDGGFYSPVSHAWRYVKNVTYVTTVNTNVTADVPKLSQRLLRHFSIFGCPYPGGQELKTIFTTLLHMHFLTPESSGGSSTSHHLNIHDDKVLIELREEEEAARQLVNLIVGVTVELQDRLRTMFLPTSQRCHYIFTIRDLSNVFRNICLSLQPGAAKNNILLLWQHECFWLYGRRMVDDVDFRRFRQAFVTAVRKQFSDEDQIHMLIKPRLSTFSNLIEQDSGIVTAGMTDSRHSSNVSEEDAKTDLYRAVSSLIELKDLLERGVEEYNKIHPRIKLALYKSVIEQVCRLARTIASPHEAANTVLTSEGCPGRCTIIVKLSAHLCGYTVYQISPTPTSSTTEHQMEQFKADLVHGYTRAGTKGEKILLLLHEEELLQEDFLVFLIEFIVSGSISHLFTQEEQTTIINSIRTEVTQAGLTYTRDVAWNFFVRTVRNNFRVCLIAGNGGVNFQRRCREYPALTKNVKFIWFPHWSKLQLVEHSLYHLRGVEWMSDIQRENIAHMLASMHLVLRQQDGGESNSGEYKHVTNTSFEKFVEKFISLACTRHQVVNEVQVAVTKTLQTIRHENEIAIKLKKQLEHEMVVLEERKAGTIKILSQIGQDTAITEQQVKVVKNQLEKIQKLKKLLPEYQVAHERAVYKAIAIVADTKKVVQSMDVDKLSELRAMSKPIIDIEDLMATIIMILKSPSADLTWQKGAKRQMANLERFIEELMTFDDTQLPETTLDLVEPYLKKPSFDPEVLKRKTSNSACASLCKWVRGVVKYHRMMISKVKPLHSKVDETTQAVDSAEQRMNTLESKRKALDIRLADLARGFEEATIDKNGQEEKTIKMRKTLNTAAQLRRILKSERQRCQQIFDSYNRRLVAVPGGCAMASAFSTYLGAYHHNFRRVMLTVHWPNCLRERGIPLVIDSIDGLRGRVIDWSINFLKTASGASSVYDVDYSAMVRGDGDDTEEMQTPKTGAESSTEKKDEEKEKAATKAEELEETEPAENHPPTPHSPAKSPHSPNKPPHSPNKPPHSPNRPPQSPAKSEPGSNKSETPKSPNTPGRRGPTEGEHGTPEPEKAFTEDGDDHVGGLLHHIVDNPDDDDVGSLMTESQAPLLTTSQYNKYVRSLIKLLVGEATLSEWIRKDFGPSQIENAAILCCSWQRPPMMIDPNGEGALWLGRLNKLLNKRKLISLDMDTRTDPQVMLSLEKAITRGKPVLLRNCLEHVDNIIMPLMHHRNMANENDAEEEARMIMFCGRRTLCHQKFRFYLSTPLPTPKFNPEIASTTTLINFGVSHDTLTEDLLTRAFARIRPDLYKERMMGLKNLQLTKDMLYSLSDTVKQHVLSEGHEATLSSAKALQFVTDLTDAKVELAKKLDDTQNLLDDLELLKDELFPLARRAAMLYAILRSLSSIHKEYQFTLTYFLELFDEAVGGALPADFGKDSDAEDVEEVESVLSLEYGFEMDDSTEAEKRARVGSVSSHVSDPEKTPTDNKPDSDLKEAGNASETTAAGHAEKDKLEPSHLETAIDSTSSTEAAHKLIAGSESEDLPPIELPEMVPLPTEGVEYKALSVNKIKQLMDILTSLVYHRIRLSLFEEDGLKFATLLCLNVQSESGEVFSSEEMSLLLQGNPGLGMQLTLSDFDCNDPPPQWLSQEKWEDILALSVLPGPLDSLCVDFAQNSEHWKAWYNTAYPEREPLPCSSIGQSTDQDQNQDETAQENVPARSGSRGSNQAPMDHVGTPDLGLLSEFHQLLILRMLRPDRLPAALNVYVDRNLNLTMPAEYGFNLGDVLIDAKSHLGVLLLLPPSADYQNTQGVARIKLTTSPVETLAALAKKHGVSLQQVRIADGCEILVEEAIDTAEQNDGWVVIEDLHLAPEPFFMSLKQTLLRLFKMRETLGNEKLEKSSFCVWITCEPCDRVSDFLVQNLHKVAWNHMDVASEVEDNEEKRHLPKGASITPQGYLKIALIATLKQVPQHIWEKVRDQSQLAKALVFGVALIQGVLVARQLFGSIGLSQWYPFNKVEISAAIEMIIGSLLRSDDGTEPLLEDLCYAIPQLLYGAMLKDEIDKKYIETLTQHVLSIVYQEPSSEISLGSVLIKTPQANVDPGEYADFVERTAEADVTLLALQLGLGVEKENCEAASIQFIQHVDDMFETQNQETGSTIPKKRDDIFIPKLRSALDICMEQLPPLLELGSSVNLITEEYDFPYHRPSVFSFNSQSSTQMPESIGYVLLQECLWMNSVLCHIRQNISDLQKNMLGGPESLPKSLLGTILSLQEEHVPVSWIHPNCQPCTHSLVTWLDDLNKRFHQLSNWVKRGMVPTFKDGVLQDNPTIASGRLRIVWLGGLVNPQALIAALRQEKAMVAHCSIDKVKFESKVLTSCRDDTLDFDVCEDGIFFSDLCLQGAGWSFEKSCLKDTRKPIYEVPCLYLCPTVVKAPTEGEREGEREKEDHDEDRLYNCPIYMNKSRQKLVVTVPLACPFPPEHWVLARTAFILDPGLPEDGCKKSRSYLLLSRMQPTTRAEDAEIEEEDLDEETRDGGEKEEELSVVSQSVHSQLSYKPMSPKGEPLPEGLAISREKAMADESMSPSHKTSPSRRTPSSQDESPDKQTSRSASKAQSVKSQHRGSSGSGLSRGTEGQLPSEQDTNQNQSVDDDSFPHEGHTKITNVDLDNRGNEPEIEKHGRQGEDERGDDSLRSLDATHKAGYISTEEEDLMEQEDSTALELSQEGNQTEESLQEAEPEKQSPAVSSSKSTKDSPAVSSLKSTKDSPAVSSPKSTKDSPPSRQASRGSVKQVTKDSSRTSQASLSGRKKESSQISLSSVKKESSQSSIKGAKIPGSRGSGNVTPKSVYSNEGISKSGSRTSVVSGRREGSKGSRTDLKREGSQTSVPGLKQEASQGSVTGFSNEASRTSASRTSVLSAASAVNGKQTPVGKSSSLSQNSKADAGTGSSTGRSDAIQTVTNVPTDTSRGDDFEDAHSGEEKWPYGDI